MLRSETAANISVVVLTVAVVVLVAQQLFSRPQPSERPPDPYSAGDPFDLEVDYPFAASERTLVLVVQSRCGFCTQSMPFYQSLIADGAKQGHLKTLVISLDPVDIGEAYLREHSIVADAVVQFPWKSRKKFAGTPTVVVVDSKATVVGLWSGFLDADREDEVRRALGIAS